MITQKELKVFFTYKNSTGELINRIYRSQKAIKGGVSGMLTNRGYYSTCVSGRLYRTHRLIFLYHKGYMPEYLDHIDGDRSNNKIENLRPCTSCQNNQNAKISKNNKSGIKGVFWDKRCKLWNAGLTSNGKRIYLGYFWDLDVAAQVVRIERIKHHGEFCNHG